MERGSLSFICTVHLWSSHIGGCPKCFQEKKRDKLMEDIKSGKVKAEFKPPTHRGGESDK